MYGTNTQYGWTNGPRASDVVELPLAPRRSGNMMCCGVMNWLSFGIILSLLAAASLALGVADVVLTYQTYMVDMDCRSNPSTSPQCDTNNLVWTWVASGIWASLPIFIFGIMAIRLGKRNYPSRTSWFDFYAFICTFIFAPAMVALSITEVVMGTYVYYWSAVDNSDDLAKAIIPIVIASLGAVELLMCFIAYTYVCCCHNEYGQSTQLMTYSSQQVDMGQRTFVQTRQPPAIQYTGGTQPPRITSSCGPCGGGGVYYRPATTTGFAPRPTTYNYFSNNRPVAQSPYAQFRG